MTQYGRVQGVGEFWNSVPVPVCMIKWWSIQSLGLPVPYLVSAKQSKGRDIS